jgi:hypothetical protein
MFRVNEPFHYHRACNRHAVFPVYTIHKNKSVSLGLNDLPYCMTTSIPFKVLNIDNEGFHLLIKVKINGKLAKLIIDTGASKTVFDKTQIEKFVTERAFDAHDKMSSGLGTNTMKSQTTVLKKISIGEVEIRDYKAVLLDLSHVNLSYGQIDLPAVDGVLGSDILLKHKAVIDYEKKTLKLKYLKTKK